MSYKISGSMPVYDPTSDSLKGGISVSPSSKSASSILSAAGPIGSLIGAGLDFFSTLNTNKLQEKMFHENMQFQREMAAENFKRSSQWNSEPAQVARLRQAGINPALAFGEGNSAQVSTGSTPSSPVPSLHAPSVGGASFGSSFGQSLGQSIDNTYKAESLRKAFRLLDEQTKDFRYSALGKANEFRLREAGFEDLLESFKVSNEEGKQRAFMLRRQGEQLAAQSVLQYAQARNIPAQLKLSYDQLSQALTIANAEFRTRLREANIHASASKYAADASTTSAVIQSGAHADAMVYSAQKSFEAAMAQVGFNYAKLDSEQKQMWSEMVRNYAFAISSLVGTLSDAMPAQQMRQIGFTSAMYK